MESGAKQLHDRSTESRNISLELVQESVRHAKFDFIYKYYEKNGKWPPIDMEEDRSSLYKSNKNINSFKHSKHHGVISYEDMDRIEILKCEEFDRLENFIPYVKDKTISLIKSKVLKYYLSEDSDTPEIRAELQSEWVETRVLLSYLLLPSNKTDHQNYLDLYLDYEFDLMKDYLVCRGVPKEKELKEKARMFGCKPAIERPRTAVIGVNTRNFLHDYSDNDAMTLSEIALARKLYAFRNMHKAYRNYSQIILCLDASGWCSYIKTSTYGTYWKCPRPNIR